jgi:acetyl-CoA carboxylase alpha subunit
MGSQCLKLSGWGCGGALAIAAASRGLMVEDRICSVISPEGSASILWRDSSKKDIAAHHRERHSGD